VDPDPGIGSGTSGIGGREQLQESAVSVFTHTAAPAVEAPGVDVVFKAESPRGHPAGFLLSDNPLPVLYAFFFAHDSLP